MEKERLTISVIVPVYNASQYLSACIESILAQTYKDYEIILVDDGSTDGSGKICDDFEKANPCIRVIHQENKGAAAARNCGIAAAASAYIAFIDSDDAITEDYLAFLANLAADNDADVAVCGYEKIYQGKRTGKIPSHKFVTFAGVEAMESLLYQKYFMSVPWGMISKRSLWDTVQFPEGKRAEDVATIYRLFAAAQTVVYDSAPKYLYYQRPSATIYTTGSKLNPDYFKHSRDMISFVKKQYPGFLDAAYSRHLSTCFQILSETDVTLKTQKLYDRIVKDIKRVRGRVIPNHNARLQNRAAAAMSKVTGIPFIHKVLRTFYKKKLGKVNNTK